MHACSHQTDEERQELKATRERVRRERAEAEAVAAEIERKARERQELIEQGVVPDDIPNEDLVDMHESMVEKEEREFPEPKVHTPTRYIQRDT